MEGVSEVKASAANHTVTVRFEDTVTDLGVITQALYDAGYTVGEPEEIVEQ